MHHFFTVDLGASSGRTALATWEDGRMSMRELDRIDNPMIPLGGHLYWDLPRLYASILDSLKRLAGEGIVPESIGIDSWGCDFAFFGRDGQLLGLPYCYRDPHTDGAAARFCSKRMSARDLYGRSGIQFMDFNSIFQLATLKENGCTALESAQKILFIPDALNRMLCGESVCEYTVASTSGMLNAATGDFDGDILSALGLERSLFGRPVRPAQVIGCLSPELQRHCGTGPVKVVAVAGHDTASAVAAVPAQDADFAYLSCGTWSLLGIESPRPIISDESFRLNFTNEGGVDGTLRFLKNICGMWIFEQCRRESWPSVPVAELVALAAASEYPALIDPDADCFSHPSSMIGAVCDYLRATGQELPASPADFCRCIFRSLAMRCRQVMELLVTMSPHPIRSLNVIGGGIRNAFLMQYMADCLEMKLVCGPVEGTAMGNALLQARAAGLCDSLADMRAVCAASVHTDIYLPSADRSGEYAEFTDIQKIYREYERK